LSNPRINPAIRFFADDAGYLAYNSESDTLHELNAVASLIFELCDGSRTASEISALVSPALPSGQHNEIDRFFADSIASGLLVSTNGSAVPPHEFVPDELSQFVDRLCEIGQSDAAIRCAKKLTQLSPGNAAAWHALGRIARLAGLRKLAADAYEQYLAAFPEDASIAHLLIALRDEPPPPRASDECVRLTFADFSSHYDTKMRDNLGYQAPERLAAFIQAELDGASSLDLLDIGCGTGLAAAALKSRTAHITGIDLSPEMIEHARARGIYDSLEVDEITDWLSGTRAQFDLIVACDCLVYFGDLSLVTRLAFAHLKPGGVFAFTVERGEIYPFHLTDSGRYTHHHDHILSVAAQYRLKVVRLQAGFLRTEAGLDVIGFFAILRKPAQLAEGT
jgi:predicted TPR repeat methyltransferase